MSKTKSVQNNPYDATMEDDKKLQRDCNGRGEGGGGGGGGGVVVVVV
jgi:hypothetical protein